jgi:hypothetical protein
MVILKKIIDVIVWALVIGSIFWLAYGMYEMINLFILRR